MTWLPRLQARDLTLCAKPGLEYDDATRQIHDFQPVVWLRQGNNTCWLDSMLVAMRMQGIGRFVYDVTNKESAVNDILTADWPRESHRLGQLRDAVQDAVAQNNTTLAAGEFGNPGDLWDFAALEIPSVSFNIAKKKICSQCNRPNYAQGPTDRSAAIQLAPCPGNTSTLPQLLHLYFSEQSISKHRPKFSRCTTCQEPLGLVQQIVVVDRTPFILCVGVNISREARDRGALPAFEDPQELLGGFDFAYQTFKGTCRIATYKVVAIVYLGHKDHWVSASLANVEGDVDFPEAVRWIVCDGRQSKCKLLDDAAIGRIIKRGKVARFLLRRVYESVGEDGYLN
jgi:hypothetical protein